jgi:CheY-like chemotaxis protein
MEVEGDRLRLEQVITNLIVNGRDAMPEGGQITITTENATLTEGEAVLVEEAYPGEFVRLVVEDTGSGMAPDTIEHIFEPFFTTKSPEGTGLGLSVVYGIVKELGGWIEVESEEGRGTSFTIYMPAIAEHKESLLEEAFEMVVHDGNGRRILLVEDDRWVRRSTAMVLSENGYAVTEACNAEDAIRLFYREKGRFDLVLSDVVMPGRSGLKMLSPLLDLNPDLPILLFSGHLDDKVELSEIMRRGIAYIHKPFEISELLRAVEETMDRDSREG